MMHGQRTFVLCVRHGEAEEGQAESKKVDLIFCGVTTPSRFTPDSGDRRAFIAKGH